jgi:hypothetical protein
MAAWLGMNMQSRYIAHEDVNAGSFDPDARIHFQVTWLPYTSE